MTPVVDDQKKLLEMVGNPEEVYRDLQSFRRSTQLLSSEHPRLIDQYQKKWVAIYDGQVVGSADTLPDLLASTDARHLPRQSIVARYIDRDQRTMIL
jgi:hypothetical protein